MKSLLLILLSVVIPINLYSQYTLEKSTNLPRSGDCILKQEVSYQSPGEKGTEVIWNFSELENKTQNYELWYISPHFGSDTIIGIEHRTLYYYRLSGDTLFSPGYENTTTLINYRVPESLLVFPFPYGRSFTTFFGGKGKYCNRLGIDICGKSTVTADAKGRMILPGGDTLRHVLRVHTYKLIFEQMNPALLFTTVYSDTFTSPACYRDSVNQYLAGDSSYYQIDTYRWYAEGYRYPVFESIHSAICKSGSKSTHFTTSYYYPPEEQYYDLDGDPENQLKRDRQEAADPSETFKAADSGKWSGSYAYEDEFVGYTFHSNEREVSLNYTLKISSDVTVGLYDILGRQMSAAKKTFQSEGSYQKQFSLAGLPAGEYLLQITIGDKIYGEKILKQ